MRSGVALCLREFPRAKPGGTPKGCGLILADGPKGSPNAGILAF